VKQSSSKKKLARIVEWDEESSSTRGERDERNEKRK
jgi:hypothetical protein